MPKRRDVLLYGATGYTGQLAISSMLALGLRPTLGGRNARSLASTAATFDVDWIAMPVDDFVLLAKELRQYQVLVNCAGPYSVTAMPLTNACIAARTHYVDVCGESAVVEAILACDGAARTAGIMLLPAAGFCALPAGCLAVGLLVEQPATVALRIGTAGVEASSRGSLRSMIEQAGGVRVREDGRLIRADSLRLDHRFDFGDRITQAFPVSLAEPVVLGQSTGVSNIAVYMEATPEVRSLIRMNSALGEYFALPALQTWLKMAVSFLPEGPTERERNDLHGRVVVEAEDAGGDIRTALAVTPEVYSFTADCIAECVRRILNGTVAAGFQTPASVFGPAILDALPGVQTRRREDTS